MAEAKEKDGPEDEGTHPYVSVMPHSNSQEKAQMKKAGIKMSDKQKQSDSYMNEDHKPSKAVDDIPKQLDAAVKMHAKQAKTLRKAGIGEERDVFEETFGKFVDESALNPFQYHPEKGGTDKGTKAQRDKIAKNIASNKKSGPMSRDPYKARAGESD